MERPGESQRVVILGAGLAGLVAAWELQRAGHHVTILEAQLHPGGRVHTIREGLSDDLYAEAGAGRIPQAHDVTMEWVKYFGLELEPFYPTTLAQVALVKGRRVILPADKPVDMSVVPLNLTPEERKAGLLELDNLYYGELAKAAIGNHIREDWPPEVAHLGDISMGDFLRQRGASEDAIHYMLLGFEDKPRWTTSKTSTITIPFCRKSKEATTNFPVHLRRNLARPFVMAVRWSTLSAAKKESASVTGRVDWLRIWRRTQPSARFRTPYCGISP
jgi:hypothetical protein